MFSRSRVRTQMYCGVAILVVIVIVLFSSGTYGAYRFRKLTKSVRERATELPLAADLNNSVSDLRVAHSHLHGNPEFRSSLHSSVRDQQWRLEEFKDRMVGIRSALQLYRDQLDNSQTSDARLADTSHEQAACDGIELHLENIDQIVSDTSFVFRDRSTQFALEEEIFSLQERVAQLPTFLKQRMDAFAEQVRGDYYSWIFINTSFSVGAVLLLVFTVFRFHQWIFRPLSELIAGSRKVAHGDYDYRIQMKAQGEMAELASAFNEMTGNFQEIKTDLDRQVQERTREVVRREQLASVGFLAAGVAHEINNPLAAIAWSAESLESRLPDIVSPDTDRHCDAFQSEVDEMKKYLRRIQDEAFRCKGITGGLLDFSRLGDVKKSSIRVAELIDNVIDMVKPLSKYRGKNILADCDQTVVADINSQEIKQVVLNLLTNALDSVEQDGTVQIQLTQDAKSARLVFVDDGCGMTEEVQQHIFEPFFTRRRGGGGTGLGLSITYRIIEEHGGSLRAFSEGAGRGSRFTVEIPLVNHEQRKLDAA